MTTPLEAQIEELDALAKHTIEVTAKRKEELAKEIARNRTRVKVYTALFLLVGSTASAAAVVNNAHQRKAQADAKEAADKKVEDLRKSAVAHGYPDPVDECRTRIAQHVTHDTLLIDQGTERVGGIDCAFEVRINISPSESEDPE